MADADDLDNDPHTDRFVNILWFDVLGNWPNQSVPTDLVSANFTISPNASDDASTKVNLSGKSAVSHKLKEGSVEITVGQNGNLDVDGNGSADALSDGILAIRYLVSARKTD